MNRKILFRGLSRQGHFWVYGLPNNRTNSRKEGNLVFDYVEWFINNVNVLSHTICQYTGLNDKNGREIYENDIVDAPYVDSIFRDVHPTARAKAVIKFVNGAFVVEYSSDCRIYLQDLNEKIIVVGDIYNNNNLLKEE